MFFFDRELNKIVRQAIIDLPKPETSMIRFAESLGNTLYLSDSSFEHNVIWLADLDGKLRGFGGLGGKGDERGQFVQVSGITADNAGNFLAICAKTSRIMAYTVCLRGNSFFSIKSNSFLWHFLLEG